MPTEEAHLTNSAAGNTPLMKKCAKCNQNKDISFFRILKSGRLLSWCKLCEREYNIIHSREYRKKNQKTLQEKAKIHWSKNREKQREYGRKSKKKNLQQQLEYQRNRRKNDETYKLKQQTRHLINLSFARRGYKKQTKTHKILNCDYEVFINHLLNTYKENYKEEFNINEKVHIDHIIPLSTAKTIEDVIRLCDYKNLQLLKEKDNLEKGNSLDWSLKNNE